MRVEAKDRRRSVLVQVDLVGVERIDGDLVAVRLARRWAGAAVGGGAEVVAPLRRARGQSSPSSSPFGQRRDVGRNIDDPPVPEAAAGGRVGIVHADGEAL